MMKKTRNLVVAAGLSLMAACSTPTPPAPIQVSNTGVGNIWVQTPFNLYAIQRLFPGYQVAMGQNSQGQNAILVGLNDGIILNILPTANGMWIAAVAVVGPTAIGPDGVQNGMPFASIYQNRTPTCKADKNEMAAYGDNQSTGLILCTVPGAPQLVYYFRGTGEGANGMPTSGVVASWSLAAMVWNSNNPENASPAN